MNEKITVKLLKIKREDARKGIQENKRRFHRYNQVIKLLETDIPKAPPPPAQKTLVSSQTKPERICSVPGCGRKHSALSYCDLHYRQNRRAPATSYALIS